MRIKIGAMSDLHVPKLETFDIGASANVDPKGFVRDVDVFEVHPHGLYMARGADHAQFGYLESWLLPSLGLRANIFHFRPGVEATSHRYLDVAEVTWDSCADAADRPTAVEATPDAASATVWRTRDLYLDLLVLDGAVHVDDADELTAAIAAGIVDADAGARAIDRAFDALAGITDPETKRKTIGREFIRSFERAVAQALEGAPEGETVDFLVQGTLYPDVVESGGGSGTANIKSHHNVGGLPDDVEFTLVEPLRLLFKDEVRAVGRELALPEAIVGRQPFPGPGLGVRVVGELTRENLDVLRAADAIVREELDASEVNQEIWQCPVVLLADVRSVGVQGDARTYGHPIVLRPVSSEDAMTADWVRLPYDLLAKISNRITNEVSEVSRVVLDVTSKPPGTIEWE